MERTLEIAGYGPVLARLYGSPTMPATTPDHRYGPRPEDHAPFIAARLVSPEASDGPVPGLETVTVQRGYIEGMRGYAPLMVNRVPYALDALALRLPDGRWSVDPRADRWPEYVAGSGYWPRLRKLSAVGSGALAVVRWSDEDPTDTARARLRDAILPACAAALADTDPAPIIADAIAQYRRAIADRLVTLEDETRDLIDRRDSIADRWQGA